MANIDITRSAPEQLRQAKEGLRPLIAQYGEARCIGIMLECRSPTTPVFFCGMSAAYPGQIFSPEEVKAAYYEFTRQKGLMRYARDNMFNDLLLHFTLARMTTGTYGEEAPRMLHPMGEMYARLGLTSKHIGMMLKGLTPLTLFVTGSVDTARVRDPGQGMRYVTHTTLD